MSDYWFFLSYANTRGNKYVEKFYNDLADEVVELAEFKPSVKNTEISFFAKESIRIGHEWPEILKEALQTSRVLVCLYSPAYFNSDWCGKEFQVFRLRLNEYVHVSPQNVKSLQRIMPALWLHPDELPKSLPKSVTNIQYTDNKFGKKYVEEGLYQIVKHKTLHKRDYEKFLSEFAKKLFDEARLGQLPRLSNFPSFEEVESAFYMPASPLVAPGLENVGPSTVLFLFVAGQKTDYQGIRDKVDSYGNQGGSDWRPYFPEFTEAVGTISKDVASREDPISKIFILTVDQNNLVDELNQAKEKNKIVIIVVDPWSIQIQSYENRMRDCDQSGLVNCGVLVIWNEKDNETNQNSEILEKKIKNTFSRSWNSKDTYFRYKIHSVDELQNELRAAINEIRMRIIKRAEARPVEGTGNNSIPMISGPGGSSVFQDSKSANEPQIEGAEVFHPVEGVGNNSIPRISGPGGGPV